MVTDKLSIYNGALRELGETPLSTLTDARAARRTLDAFYTDALKYCLEIGLWTFAERTLKLENSTSFTPAFGYQYFFDKPNDYENLCGIWTDEYLRHPLGSGYDEDKNGWYADVNEIYVKYVSNDTSYGYNLGIYPASYKLFLERHLAFLCAPEITKSITKTDKIERRAKIAERTAKNSNARSKPVRSLPSGSWVNARHFGYADQTGHYKRY